MVLVPTGPDFMGAGRTVPLFPALNPAIACVPIGFLGAILGARLLPRDAASKAQLGEVVFRTNTGLRHDAPVGRSLAETAGGTI